jgi:hypothetical protein
MYDRAAQFAPFAALVGYDDAVAETARLTESRPELDEQEQRELNARLCALADHIQDQPEVRIRYFVPDERKSGGAIVEVCGVVKRLSLSEKNIIFYDGQIVPFSDITEIDILE